MGKGVGETKYGSTPLQLDLDLLTMDKIIIHVDLVARTNSILQLVYIHDICALIGRLQKLSHARQTVSRFALIRR